MYHVKFDRQLSPPDLFETTDQAHEFFMNNSDADDIAYTREEVRPATLGDLITTMDLTAAMRENAQFLFGDDSLLDTTEYMKNKQSLMEDVRATMNAWGEAHGVIPSGQIVVSSMRVSVLRKP